MPFRTSANTISLHDDDEASLYLTLPPMFNEVLLAIITLKLNIDAYEPESFSKQDDSKKNKQNATVLT